jgi:hypothetical protein
MECRPNGNKGMGGGCGGFCGSLPPDDLGADSACCVSDLTPVSALCMLCGGDGEAPSWRYNLSTPSTEGGGIVSKSVGAAATF